MHQNMEKMEKEACPRKSAMDLAGIEGQIFFYYFFFI